MIHSVLDEVVMREQAGMRSLLSKLLAVVVWVMLLVCVVCRMLFLVFPILITQYRYTDNSYYN